MHAGLVDRGVLDVLTNYAFAPRRKVAESSATRQEYAVTVSQKHFEY